VNWSQNYSPLGSLGVSALVAALPVVTLLGLLAFFHVRAQFAALAGLFVAGLIAIFVYHMPASLTFMSMGYGAAFGLLPIGWIILNAIFVYNISIETGGFIVLQKQVAGISADRRIQALLIAFSFGAFVEGAAGFGTPVAISGALLIGLGFRPLEAAKLTLIGNTAPVAFGALGTPLVTLAKITNLDLHLLSATVGRQLSPIAVIIPFWLVIAQVGWRGMIGVWPACLVGGLSFAVTELVVSTYQGPELVGIISAVVSMASLIVLMKFWKPAEIQSIAREDNPALIASNVPVGSAWKAWLPWIVLSVLVFAWGKPQTKSFLNNLYAPNVVVPQLHNAVLRMPPVVLKPTPEPAIYAFNVLSATGTALLLTGVVAGLCLGLGPARLFMLYGRTFWRVRVSLLTIAVMLALGYTTRFSGTDTTMGLVLAGTGFFFPFFSPLIGWLGVALTGSDTSSNVLFGNLQQVTAQQLNLSPILMTASNSSGGVMGKMIDAQSIVVASVATGGRADSPDAGTILRSVFWHSLALGVLMGVLVMLQAYVWPGIVPAQK
jgi:lactate permease